ncbi:MAG: cupin domain-containing protein [Eubacteriaceae bacterium]|nr:cupin domain-containing protein [Eubacteriaceae bacterium]
MITKKNALVTEIKENMRGENGAPAITHIVGGEILGNKGRMYSKIVMQPGDSIGYHQHVGEQEIFYFLSGEGMVKDNEETIKTYPGDVMVTPDQSYHSIENTGIEELVFMALILNADA